MKKTIIKIIVFLLTFLVSLAVISRVMNQGHNNMTMEIAPASLPVVTMEKDGIAYNELHGCRQPVNVAFQRETVTELGEDRNTSFVIDTYGEDVKGVSIEVRSTDGKRLIENTPVTDYVFKNDRTIYANIALKDLIERDTEYALVILLDMGEETVRYYTRVVWSEDTHALEKLAFVKDFHETLYDRELAREKNLTRYLESNSSGDNTTFHKVNIHSSFKQITWGDLNVKEETDPVIQMTELASQTSSVVMKYVVSTSQDNKKVYYAVEEFYRVRFLTNAERMYLLDYQRTMTQIPNERETFYANDKILLGIVEEETPFLESEDGNIIVFQMVNRLFSYNVSTNKLTVLFSFYDKENADARTFYDRHNIKVLDVDEGGNVRFAVYGYMNRGRHEGELGIQVYYYDSALNTIEEAVYIPYYKSYAVLAKEMEELLFLNRENKLYLFLENTVYEMNMTDKTCRGLVSIVQDGSMQVSDSHKVLVWQEGEDVYHGRRLQVRNLNTGTESEIQAGAEEYIRPLGFMGEDVIYGLARQEDISVDNAGRVFFPMYRICIANSAGELLKKTEQENIFVTDCTVTENQITLERVQRSEKGTYQAAAPDYIMTNEEAAEGKNRLVTADIDVYEKYVQIQVRKPIDEKTLQVLNPKEVVFEGDRTIDLEAESRAQRYYVFAAGGVSGIYLEPAKAVIRAYDESGVVIDGNGKCVWLRGNRVVRNQIMAIKEEKAGEERSSLAVCLDTILQHKGIVRNSQSLLDQGQSAVKILEDGLPDADVLDLTGCSLDAILYYVNQDIPVLAVLNNGEAVLVTGFNEFNVVIMEPSSGKIYKKGMNDSAEWFAENGNSFVTYALPGADR